jgi:hypothetical protein
MNYLINIQIPVEKNGNENYIHTDRMHVSIDKINELPEIVEPTEFSFSMFENIQTNIDELLNPKMRVLSKEINRKQKSLTTTFKNYGNSKCRAYTRKNYDNNGR